jgi:peptide-methionine (S)-S-oxide reductase
VGYAGGTTKDPTYHNIGDHSESVQVEYDPTMISYQELLDAFWQGHNPTRLSYSRQYASIVFYHDETQKALAIAAKARESERRQSEIATEVIPAAEFYQAEDYHQKYYLRQYSDLVREFRAIYPGEQDFVLSTAVARANGYAAGYGTCEELQAEVDRFGLSPRGSEELLDLACPPRR